MNAIISSFKELIASFTENPMNTLITGNAGAEIGLPVLIVAAIGFIECVFGLKLLRLEMILFGFAAGFFVGDFLAGIDEVAALLATPEMKYALMGILGIALITGVHILLLLLLIATPLSGLPIILPFLWYMAAVTFTSAYAAYPIIDRYMIAPYINNDHNNEGEDTEEIAEE